MTTLEKCARALQRRDFLVSESEEADRIWNDTFDDDPYKEVYRNDARAVLSALMEPDEATLQAVKHMTTDWNSQGEIFATMIRHILDSGQTANPT